MVQWGVSGGVYFDSPPLLREGCVCVKAPSFYLCKSILPCVATAERMASRLHAITLFARAGDGVGSLPTIVRFFKEGLLLNVTELGQEWARVDSGASVPIMVQTAGKYALCARACCSCYCVTQLLVQ